MIIIYNFQNSINEMSQILILINWDFGKKIINYL